VIGEAANRGGLTPLPGPVALTDQWPALDGEIAPLLSALRQDNYTWNDTVRSVALT
jgi:hypothetical protein